MPIFQEIVTSAELPTFTATLKASELMALGYFLATACKDFASPKDFDLSLSQSGNEQEVLLLPKTLALVKQIQRVNQLDVDPSQTALFLSGNNVFESMLARKTTTHTHVARDREHLRVLMYSAIKEKGDDCSLNHIDVSGITDMHDLFARNTFVGDISKWDVSNVTQMENMFVSSIFSGDISGWNVSKVKNMEWMFHNSKFKGDLSKWDVSSVTSMSSMFSKSKFDGDISRWNTSRVTSMYAMFENSKFKGDISKWDVSNAKALDLLFKGSRFQGDLSRWNIQPVQLFHKCCRTRTCATAPTLVCTTGFQLFRGIPSGLATLELSTSVQSGKSTSPPCVQ